ncbi:MAG: hypothetical protein HDT28_01730 [Clostridiales bacterium]|nr:hypothetical protein [Clostridiales bacterium]
MVAWLKFYFLSFFSNRISKEGATRSIANSIVSLVLAFMVICCGLIAGYVVSFNKHYGSSPDFSEFAYSIFADGEQSIELSVSNGKLNALIPDGVEFINGFADESCDYNKNGYSLVVDTRGALDAEQKTKYAEYAYKSNVENYLILLDDTCFCSFTTSGGITVEFVGGYFDMPNGEVGGDRESIDTFVKELFRSSVGTEFLVYLISASRVAILYLAAVLILALIAYLAVKFLKSELCGTYTETLKIIGSYVFISAIIAFFAILIASTFLSQSTTFNLGGIIFIVVLLIRTAVAVIPAIISDRRKMNSKNNQEEIC